MKSYLIFVFVVNLLVVICGSEYARYDNYRVYSLMVETAKHRDVVNALEQYSDSYVVLDNSNSFARNATVIVPPHKFGEFATILAQHTFKYEITNDNLQAAIDEERNRIQMRKLIRGEFNWNEYHRLGEIYEWMKMLATAVPNKVSLLTIGKSHEGREILGVRLSYKEGNPGIILESGIHAREWIAPAVVTYILNELINSNDTQVRAIAESYDWYVIPVANPDGYEYTHVSDRFWRKTRKPYYLVCYGADPNRNWNHHWGEQGTSPFPCAETYKGPKAFSENETASLARFLETLKGKVQAYIAFHSFSQLLLFPYGYTKQHATNHDDLQQIGNKAAAALAKRYGTSYKVGNIYEAIYPASGSSMEWAYDTLKTKIAYTYELRPDGRSGGANGFILPANQIIPTGEETLDSLVALLNEARALGY